MIDVVTGVSPLSLPLSLTVIVTDPSQRHVRLPNTPTTIQNPI